MAQTGLRVKGIRQLHRALKAASDAEKKLFEDELKEAGQIVATGARQRFSVYDVRSAAGIRPKVRGFGRVVVEQSRRRTTGQHPEFGSLQMRRALLPSLDDNEGRIVQSVEKMLDRIGGRF